jgi:hypothetical protein
MNDWGYQEQTMMDSGLPGMMLNWVLAVGFRRASLFHTGLRAIKNFTHHCTHHADKNALFAHDDRIIIM